MVLLKEQVRVEVDRIHGKVSTAAVRPGIQACNGHAASGAGAGAAASGGRLLGGGGSDGCSQGLECLEKQELVGASDENQQD